jgi:hypothetical protein
MRGEKDGTSRKNDLITISEEVQQRRDMPGTFI